jgi:hypothetical protein
MEGAIMPNFEELIYQRLTQDQQLTSLLAKFKTLPAVFEMQAPSDADKGWSGKQYPRVNYSVDKQENPERKVSGTVVLDVLTTTDQEAGPEVVEARIKDLLSNNFFEPDSEPVIALVWNQTNAFQEDGGNDELVIGATITFDMLAFPVQTTAEPDPISAFINWTTSKYPGVHLFNTVPQPPYIWTPSASQPAIYWRLAGTKMEIQTNAVIWMNATIACHVFAPAPSDRLPWIKNITESLAMEERVYLGDMSPMFIRNISADSNRDPLREGQITITTRYGILRSKPSAEPLNNVNYNGAMP